MKNYRILAFVIALTWLLTVSALGEKTAWSCPECGKKDNTGKYCGSCGHPAPWLDVETASDQLYGEDDIGMDTLSTMTYAEYVAAETDAPVKVEAYVQDHQEWWDGKVTVYLQDADGAYFAYEMVCSEEDAAKLVPGTKIRVTGYKTEWAGEIEIASGCTFEFMENAEPWIAEATDVTGILATDELISHMNQFVAVKGAKIAAQADGAAFAYKNTEEKTDDLYFTVEVGGQTYDFCVEFYLRGQDSDVYKAVEGLKVGDMVDLEGFLYWYNGPNLQATGLTVLAGQQGDVSPKATAAETDLSGMTAKELTALISRAGAELKKIEPLDDAAVLYDKDGFTAAIDYVELQEDKDEIWIHLLLMNDTEYENEIWFSDVMVNGWQIEDSGNAHNTNVQPKTNSKTGRIDLNQICKLSGISSFDEIEVIDAYGAVIINYGGGLNDWDWHDMHYIMSFTRDEGIKILMREEIAK